MPLTTTPEAGQLVLARARPYLVDHVAHPSRPGDVTHVRLSCVDDDNLGGLLELNRRRAAGLPDRDNGDPRAVERVEITDGVVLTAGTAHDPSPSES